jgi:hypothetical protein
VLEVPYNNAEVLFEKQEGRRIRTFGGSCRHQLQEIALRANEREIPMQFLGACNSTHWIGIATEAEEILVMDPAMRQRDALSLTRMFEDFSMQTSSAYPEYGNIQGSIDISPAGKQSFSEWVKVKNNGMLISNGRISGFNLCDRKDELPDVDFDLRTTMEQTRHKLALFGVCADGQVVNVQMNMRGEISARLHGNPPSDEGPLLDDLLRKVVEPLGTHITPDDLKDYFSDARVILEKLLR